MKINYFFTNIIFFFVEINPNEIFDIFTADFREEHGVLEGRLLKDQSIFINDCIQVILKSYKNSKKEFKPRQVILVGHSMGGLTARAAMTVPDYVQDSIRVIITIATPHRPAILTRHSVTDFYRNVNGFWRSKPEKLSNLTLVSVW